jgi:hypothetical protein
MALVRATIVWAAILGVLCPSSARAEPDPHARALEACAAGSVAEGVALLAGLYAQTKDPTYVYNQGRCYQQNGQLEPALNRFHEYLRVGTKEPPPDIARAQGFIKEIEDSLARTRAIQAEQERARQAAAAPDGALSDRRRSRLHVAATLLGVVAVASITTGAVMGLRSQSIEREIDKEVQANPVIVDAAGLKRRLADGGRYETWQWIGYGVGVAAAAGAVTTLAFAELSRPAREQVAFVPVAGGAAGLWRVTF